MSLRNSIKKVPFLVPLARRCRDFHAVITDGCRRLLKRDHARDVFTKYYRTNYWGDSESVSGVGSNHAATAAIRRELPLLLERLGVATLVDAPCGDFRWMSEIVDSIPRYKGCDLVPELIERNRAEHKSDRVSFFVADITCDRLPSGDAILCRDCMIHLPTPLIRAALRNFRDSGFRYVLLTHDVGVAGYREIVTGGWRPIDWTNAPFHFPQPLERIIEAEEQGRHLAVWEIASLEL